MRWYALKELTHGWFSKRGRTEYRLSDKMRPSDDVRVGASREGQEITLFNFTHVARPYPIFA